jgi:hypothetical protein
MSDRPAAEVSLPDLRDLLNAFVLRNSHDRDLGTRFIAARADNLRKEISSVMDPSGSRMPAEIEAGIRELRLKELLDQRRELSKQIDALDAEERNIKSLDKTA